VAQDGGRETKVCLPPKPRAIPSVSSLRSLCRLMKCLSGSMLHLTGMHTFSSLSRGVLFSGSPSLCDLRRWGGIQLTTHSTCTGEWRKNGRMRRNWRRECRKQEAGQWEVPAKDQCGSPSVFLTCWGALGLGDQCSHSGVRIQPVSEHMGWRQVKGSR